MATTNDPPNGDTQEGSGTVNRTIAWGQFLILVAFVTVTLGLAVIGRDVPDNLWTITVSVVSYFLGQRAPILRQPPRIDPPIR